VARVALYCSPARVRRGVRTPKIKMTLFNTIGKTYNNTRLADERIVAELIKLINLKKDCSIIADIGAGTGNYSIALANAGFKIRAIEPSAIMLSHSKQNPNIEWIIECAENIPLKTGSVDAAFSVLALPHFSDIEQAFKEMARILKKGSIVIFTFDPKIGRKTWMYSYFPFCWDKFNSFPTAEETAKLLSNCTNLLTQIIPFKLPSDLKDNFAAAAWRKPHWYLNQDYRSNISSFRMTDTSVVDDSVKRLSADLESGRWEKLYGKVLHMDRIDAGYYFLLAR
jgi:ubiquinone/menaquinone biosynthesis C-methylase UbiE